MEQSTRLSADGNHLELRELEHRLKYGLEKCRIKDMAQISERIRRTEERIEQYENEDRKSEAEQERRYLSELKQLQVLRENISVKYTALLSKEIPQLELSELEDRLRYILEKCKMKEVEQLTERLRRTEKRIEQYEEEKRGDAAGQEIRHLRDLEQVQRITEEIVLRRSTGSIPKDETQGIEATKRLILKNLRNDIILMPCCAEKTIMKLIAYFQQKLLGEKIDEHTADFIPQSCKELHDQIEKEKLSSEQIRTSLQDFDRFVHNEDGASVVRVLSRILAEIRPLYMQEIQRLIERTNTTAQLISNRDIVLLIGATGSGKSTTIQFLTGAKMKNTVVEIASGRFLEHITADRPVRNAGLNHITSSPLSKSETRHLIPVTVLLQDVLGSHESGEIILCDVPGFGDTAGPEVDIANGIGVINAIRTCHSVKILALSSYTSLGDRGDGIEKLARILIQMIDGVEERVDSVSYAFTKYPSSTDVHPIILDFKKSRVDENPSLKSDSALVAVLNHMIEKTKQAESKIDPIHDDPKILIKKLRSSNAIRYPSEVFRYSLTQDTQHALAKHAQRYYSSILGAMKNRDTDLVMYYLNSLKFLSDLTKEHAVRDAYERSVEAVSDDIEKYCRKTIEHFNRYFISQDGLKDEDVREYQLAHDYLEQVQIFKEHLGSKIVSLDLFIESILSTLEKQNLALREIALDNPAIGIFLDNFRRLRNPMKELRSPYEQTCQEVMERFQSTLVESVPQLIQSNDFEQLGQRLSTISKCLPMLNSHSNGRVEEIYRDIVRRILDHLNSFSDEANTVVSKMELNDKDVEILQNYIASLKSAKKDLSLEATQNLDKVYDEFINRLSQHFEKIHVRIKELFDRSGVHALENVESLVSQMEMILRLPEMAVKVARTFRLTIENIQQYMRQQQREAEDVFYSLNHQSGVVSFRPLARLLSRLKNSQWIDRFLPGTSDSLMRVLREELEGYAEQLENRLKKLELNLKNPESVRAAQEMLEKIEAMKVLEPAIPQLKPYRDRIDQYLLDVTKDVFGSIQKTFDLAGKTTQPLRDELSQLEQIKKEYDQVYPARIFLRKSGYSDIDILNHKIEDLKRQRDAELSEAENEKQRIKSLLNEDNLLIQHPRRLSSPKVDQKIFDRLVGKISKKFHRLVSRENEYFDDEVVDDTMTEVQRDYHQLLQSIEQKRQQFSGHLIDLQSIRDEYSSLAAERHSLHPSPTDFLQAKGQISYELLEETIKEKRRILTEYEHYEQKYYFNDRLDAGLANQALIYIGNAEKVGHPDVRVIAESTDEVLKKYLEEYGDFLAKEMEKNFEHITRIDESNRSQYSNDLHTCLDVLFSFKRYPLVFATLHGEEKIDRWCRKLLTYHHSLESELEVCHSPGENQELQNHLAIAQTLSDVDHFWTTRAGGNDFRGLYSHYQKKISEASRQAQEKAIEFITRGDFVGADLALSDVVDSLSNSRLVNYIKGDLHTSLNKMFRETKSCAHQLDRKIERNEDHREKFRQITDSIDKTRTVLSRNRLVALLDEPTKNMLQKFEQELNPILSTVFLNGLNHIAMSLDGNQFLEAEQCMQNLLRAHHEFIGYYTSKVVETKIIEIRKRLNTLPESIVQRYNFADLNNYLLHPPTDILNQLERAVSSGYPRYAQVERTFIERIRLNFALAIDRVRKNPLNDFAVKTRSIREAFHFLPEKLKPVFQMEIDELNQLKPNVTSLLEFD